ncbi:MAG: PEGA domain-containing protein [bacterium]|nr:PEGA domain-containing protein [bacterium]
MKRFLSLFICLILFTSLLSNYSLASPIIPVNISPPKNAQPNNISYYLKSGSDVLILFRVSSIPALGSMNSFFVTITYSGESFNYEIYNGVNNPNSPGSAIEKGTLSSPTSILFPWDSDFINISGQRTKLASPIGLKIVNTGKKDGTISVKIGVNENVGGIVINSKPSGASVYVDNRFTGMTPIKLSGIKTGSHTVRISYQGYADRQKTVIIRPHRYEYITETLLTPVNTGSLYVESNPRGASIYLDGSYEGETPKRIDFIPVGSHSVRLSKDGYRDYIQQVWIEANKVVTVSVNLLAETTRYKITINSNPSGAWAYVDGIPKGTTPTYVYVTPGYHEIKLQLQGYLDYEETIYVTRDMLLNINLQVAEGALVVFSEPLGADVYIDGRYYGKTPITIQRIPVGRKIVTLKMAGYADWSDDILIETGQISQINAVLKLAGTLQVSSNPPGARVYLNGKDIGTTPLSNSSIPEGTHNLSIELFGYKPWRGIIEIIPRQITNIFANLESAPIDIPELSVNPQVYKVKTLFKRDLSINFTITKPATVTVEIRDMEDKVIAVPMSGFKASIPKLEVKWRDEVPPGNYKVAVIALDEDGEQAYREAIFRVEEESILNWILYGIFGALIIWLLSLLL